MQGAARPLTYCRHIEKSELMCTHPLGTGDQCTNVYILFPDPRG